MEAGVKRKLELANKLIFVKKYAEAEAILTELVKSRSGQHEGLIHLRRIELGLKQQTLPELIKEYQQLSERSGTEVIGNICLCMAAQHNETLSPGEAVEKFQELIKKFGENAACYYGIAISLEVVGNNDRAIYNYKQSLTLDPEWYPSYFGLSQIYYSLSDSKNGDQNFYQFESLAPFNVYGNFDTHRKLYKEFFEQEAFAEAEMAVATLGQWWVDNKGYCPSEIRIYEKLALRNLADKKGDLAKSRFLTDEIKDISATILNEVAPKDGILYFIAKSFEEFGDSVNAYKFYKKILRVAGSNPVMVQKIGGQFLSTGEYKLAQELFNEAYEVFPDNPEIRFCRLVSMLKLAKVNVEEYLLGKERLKQLVLSDNDKVEILALLHSLLAKFQDDPDVHFHMADIYLHLGNSARAEKHFKRMYELDKYSRVAILRYVSYLMQHGDATAALGILGDIPADAELKPEEQTEIFWLKANYFFRQREFAKARDFLLKVLHMDPWNVSYIVHDIICQMELAKVDAEMKSIDAVLLNLQKHEEQNLSWSEFDSLTLRFEELHLYELVYSRRKLNFLYANGNQNLLKELIASACKFDPSKATFDFMRLLNTNFDSALVYWSLGILHKELWQLEIAGMWFEQMLLHPKAEAANKANGYLELADNYIWLGKDLNKAIEFIKIAMELHKESQSDAQLFLAHAYLKLGQVRQAEALLESESATASPEKTYLLGLVHYRNGAPKKAKEIWKPLLTIRSKDIRLHNIKQEIMRFYYDGEPYLKVH